MRLCGSAALQLCSSGAQHAMRALLGEDVTLYVDFVGMAHHLFPFNPIFHLLFAIDSQPSLNWDLSHGVPNEITTSIPRLSHIVQPWKFDHFCDASELWTKQANSSPISEWEILRSVLLLSFSRASELCCGDLE